MIHPLTIRRVLYFSAIAAMKSISTPSPFQIAFPNGQTAHAVRMHRTMDVSQMSSSLEAVGLVLDRPTLVLVGGASGISEPCFQKLEFLFREILAPLMESVGGMVVDGGTDAGVMKLMGEAHRATHSTFPLVGVAAIGTVVLPGKEETAAEHSAPLEPNHTHFVLVPGLLWGDEAPWIANVATALTLNAPSITVLVNGGRIALQDAFNSIRVERPVYVVDGSGRTADELAAALRGESVSDRAIELAESGLIQSINLRHDPSELMQLLSSGLLRHSNVVSS
jgi:hypothetical protein